MFFQFSLLTFCALFYSFGVNAQTVVNFGGLETPTVLFAENFDGNWTTPGALSPAWSQAETGDRQWHKNNYTTGWTGGNTGSYAPSGANTSTGSARFHSSVLTNQFNQNTQGKFLSPILSALSYDISVTVEFYFNNTSGDDFLSLSYNSWAANGSQPNVYTPIYISKTGTNTSNSITNNWAQLESYSFVIPSNSTFQIVFSGIGGLSTTTDIGIDEISISYTRVNSQKWFVPQNVYCVQAETWGGGAAGGKSNAISTSASGGGGGGSYAKDTSIMVVPGEFLNYNIGQGGNPQTESWMPAYVAQGGITYFGNPNEGSYINSILLAQGGLQGGPSECCFYNNLYHNGGWPNTSQPLGDITFKGGYGGATPGGLNAFGGVGGTGAGISQNGNFNNDSDITGSLPQSVPGGAEGVASYFGRGVKGNPGGGGGSGSVAGFASGQGGIGNVRITYFSCDQVVIPSATIASNTLVCPNENFNLSIQFNQNYRCLAFQWLSSTDGVNFSILNNFTEQTITTSQNHSNYYACQVICGGNIIGNTPPIFIETFVTPTISLNTSIINVCLNGSTNEIILSPFDQENGSQFQWYYSTNESYESGVVIAGENQANYSPNTDSIYNGFYYCSINLSPSGCTIFSPFAQTNIFPTPNITLQPIAEQKLCVGGFVELNLTSSNDTNIDTYQWFMNTIPSITGSSPIFEANSNVYTAQLNNTGIYYFFNKVCGTVLSDISQITVFSDPLVITNPISNQQICVGGISDTLEILVSGGTGVFNYQWYSNNSNSTNGGVLINDANTREYLPQITNSPGELYFYSITNVAGSGCESLISSISTILVVADPVINITPNIQSLCFEGIPEIISVSTSGITGNPSLSWYSSTSNNYAIGTVIFNTNNSQYLPPSSTEAFYYCVLSTSVSGCSDTSAISKLEVLNTAYFENQIINSQNACIDSDLTSLELNASPNFQTPLFQWYENTTPNYLGALQISSETSNTYTPGSNSVSNKYYFCSLNYTNSNCPSLYSDISNISIVNDLIATPNSIVDLIVCTTSSSTLTVASSELNGNHYQWFSNTTNSSLNAILIENQIDSLLTIENLSAGETYYYCLLTNEGTICQNAASPFFTINALEQPSISSQTINLTACLNNEIPSFSLSGNLDSLAEFHFFQSNTIDTYDGSEISTTNYTPSSNDLGNDSYYFTYNVNYPGCIADSSGFYNVSITDIPTLTLGSNESLVGCSGAEIELTNTVSPNLTSDYILVWNLDNSTSDTTHATNVFSTLPIETAGNHNMQVQMLSTLDYCSATDELNLTIDIVPNPSISEELNFIQTLCPFDQEIDAPTVLLDFDNLIGPPTYTWNQVEQSTLTPIANSNQNSYLPLLPMNGVFNSQCLIQFDYPGCDVLTSSLSALTFDKNNLDCFPELVIPEAISPNNDGMNDFWTIPGIEQFNGYEINIFNSFGQSIYFVKNTPPNWDGMWNGQTLPNGDYFYAVKLIELNRTIFGTVSLAK